MVPSRFDAPTHLQTARLASLQNRRALFVYLILAAMSGLLAAVVPKVALFLAMICGGALGLALGRWQQARQIERWLQAWVQGVAEPDWDNVTTSVPPPGIRLFASVEEAASHGWEMGPARSHYEGRPIPSWAEKAGQRFIFDGLQTGTMHDTIPDTVRVFGRLRYIRAALVSDGASSASF